VTWQLREHPASLSLSAGLYLSRRDSTELAEAYARWIGRQLDSDAGRHVGAAIMEPVLQVPKRNSIQLAFGVQQHAASAGNTGSRATAPHQHPPLAARRLTAVDEQRSMSRSLAWLEPLRLHRVCDGAQGSGGMVLVDPAFQRAVVAEARARGIPVIFDEARRN
jgi:hypothetical protein